MKINIQSPEDAILKTIEALKQQLLSWKEKTQINSHKQNNDLIQPGY